MVVEVGWGVVGGRGAIQKALNITSLVHQKTWTCTSNSSWNRIVHKRMDICILFLFQYSLSINKKTVNIIYMGL